MRGLCAALAGLVVALAPAAASAADVAAAGAVVPARSYDWTVTVGAEGRFEPVFQGADRNIWRPYPIVSVRRFGKTEPFRNPRDGIGIGLIEGSNFQIGPVGKLIRARNEGDDPAALRGLGDVPWAVEVGIFAEYWSLPWLRTRAEVRQGFNGHHGVVADVLVDAVVPIGPQWTLSGGPRLTLASARAVSPYFSVDPIQSAVSGFPTYDAKGGVRSVGAGAKARYQWTPQLAIHTFVEFERLTGAVANSPLVAERGAADQLTIGFGASHTFDIKTPW